MKHTIDFGILHRERAVSDLQRMISDPWLSEFGIACNTRW